MPWFFLELLTSRFESCSSFADSGSLERPVVAVSSQRVTVIDATLVEVRFQHIFEALLVRRLAFRAEDLLSEEYTGLAFVLHGRSTLVYS